MKQSFDQTPVHLVRRVAKLIAATMASLCCMAAWAQQTPVGNDAIYRYQGADREQRLIAGARKERTALLYTSLAPTESRPLAEAFEKKYGVKIDVWRALSEQVVQRAVNETRAKRFTVDIVETNGPEMEMMAREKLFSEFSSPVFAELPAHAIPQHRQWVPDRLNFFVVGYNTAKVRASELPKSYDGFLDPKWKGRLGIEATDVEWMATVVKLMGQQTGTSFFERLALQQPDMRKGHVLLAELIASGEIPVGLTAYSGNIDSLKRRGAPVDWLPVEPVVARPQGIAIARFAPHPHAALLFADFVLSEEGQALLLSLGRTPVNVRIKSNQPTFHYTLVDSSTLIEDGVAWNKMWDHIFSRPNR